MTNQVFIQLANKHVDSCDYQIREYDSKTTICCYANNPESTVAEICSNTIESRELPGSMCRTPLKRISG
ncbi:hypothetical protein [Sphingobacterium paludis]|uniref:Uncharacterized protein n=1 Tax=Sphingobacterium paludis TaxID=1476465 RepID=A0A4R7D119_9SPHI|nr:hypothetical protein [Sphingobacterium paludis]TDS13184.1 hypothetical protein B0I21_105318 [Sphingobacterium paludis]